MKKLFLLLVAGLCSITTFANPYLTGNKKLDRNLINIDHEARRDKDKYVKKLKKNFDIKEEQYEELHLEREWSPGDIYLALSIAKVKKVNIDIVQRQFQLHRTKGWSAILKALEIKDSTPAYDKIQSTVKKGTPKRDYEEERLNIYEKHKQELKQDKK
ncbi:hypothetical protein [Pleionea sp. CnH1-48]|uniref:hypothetical protein n=1 Tax=Pleionea sp. CnH1-48 TaxID=2954494 RepID=UPI002097DBDA|nr:hypothetical protein [Pleionea sp. CnH1-48]MCO7224698.1 hypothetical protein [Pleionea sp. CnH1-48]